MPQRFWQSVYAPAGSQSYCPDMVCPTADTASATKLANAVERRMVVARTGTKVDAVREGIYVRQRAVIRRKCGPEKGIQHVVPS